MFDKLIREFRRANLDDTHVIRHLLLTTPCEYDVTSLETFTSYLLV